MGPNQVKQINEHTCGICKEELTGYDEIKEHCKQNNLEGAMEMRSNFVHLKTQIEELESRSTITAMISTYLNQTKSLFGLNQPVHSELNALFMGIKDMDQTLVLLRNQNNDSLLFVQDTLSQIPLQD